MLSIIFKTPSKIHFNKELNCFFSISEVIELLDTSYILKTETINAYTNYYPSEKCYSAYLNLPCENLYAKCDKKLLIEFASPNPVSDIHIGNLVNAVYGAGLYQFLKSKFTTVQSEFYVNDLGSVISKAVYAKLENKSLALNQLYTDYIKNNYTSAISETDLLTIHNQLRLDIVKFNLENILSSLKSFNITFDTFAYESLQLSKFNTLLNKHKDLFELTDELLYFKLSASKKILCKKSNSDFLYFSKDLALNYDRVSTYDDVYVVFGDGHRLYSHDMQKCLTLLTLKRNFTPILVPTIKLDNVKMSKRKDNAIYVPELLKQYNTVSGQFSDQINLLKLYILFQICCKSENNINLDQKDRFYYYILIMNEFKRVLDTNIAETMQDTLTVHDYDLLNHKIYCLVNLQHVNFTRFLNEFHLFFKKGSAYLKTNKNYTVIKSYYEFLQFLLKTINLEI